MSDAHFSLQRPFNKKLLFLWSAGAAVALFAAKPLPILPAALGAAAGVIIGKLQVASMGSSPSLFAAARSALEVRRAFWSTASGKWSIILLWVTAAVLLGVSFAYGGNPLRGYLAGYFLMMLCRESMTLRATRSAV